jgi:hypothetical protein
VHKYASVIGLLAVLLIAFPVDHVSAQTAAHLTVTITGQSLTAGFNNTVTITILNDFYTAIYDVDVAVTVPTGLTMVGDNHWHYDSINMGDSITISFQIYPPTSAIGTSYQGSVSATYKQLGDLSYTQETHTIGLSVYGWINLKMYGLIMTPSLTTPGGNATVSGNILNSGNLAAYNANVSVQSDTLPPGTSASAFVGEVDPNIPRPFSIFLVFNQKLSPGNYSITVKLSAIDNSRPSSPFTDQQISQIQIRRPTQVQTSRFQGETGIIGVILEILRNLYIAFFGSPSNFPTAPF